MGSVPRLMPGPPEGPGFLASELIKDAYALRRATRTRLTPKGKGMGHAAIDTNSRRKMPFHGQGGMRSSVRGSVPGERSWRPQRRNLRTAQTAGYTTTLV